MKKNKAAIMIASAMTIFGTLGLFVRNIPISSGELAMCRAVMASVLIGIYLLITGKKIPFAKLGKSLVLLFVSGVAMGINWILLFEAYKYTTVATATLSYYFAPVIVTAVSPLLFREKLTPKQIICFVMSSVGIVMITVTGDMSSGGSDFIGILFGLGAAVFYASVVLLNKFIKEVDGIPRTFIQFVAAAITLVPYVLFSGGIHFGALDVKGIACLLTVGLFHTGVTYCIYFSSLKELPGQEAAILSYIDPLVAVLVSVVLLKEHMTPWQIAGGALILGFTLLNEISFGKKSKK